MNKLILTIYLVLVIVSSAYGFGTKILVKPTILKSVELYDKYVAYGECRNLQSRDYYANVTGIVDQILAKQGDQVKAGEIIIAIDQNIANATKAQAEVSLKAAELSYSRDKMLYTKKIISEELLEKSKVNYEETRVKAAQNLKSYNDMVITAPFNAEVGVVKTLVGNKVNQGDYLFSLIANSESNIFLELPETLYKKVSAATAIILADTNGNTAMGKVIATSPYLSDNGTITAKISTAYGKFIHGSYVNAEIITNKHKGLAALEQSVMQNDKGSFIYLIDANNIIKQVYIKLGTRTGDLIEVLSDDLKEGDIVVLEGLTKVHEGTAVEIIK